MNHIAVKLLPTCGLAVTKKWKGLLIEPSPFVFKRLAKSYTGLTGVRCINCAISDKNGNAKFWYVKKNNTLDAGYDQIGSLDKGQVIKHNEGLFKGLMPFLDSCEVRCSTLHDILNEYGITKIDVFFCDAEGYDARIIMQIDFSLIKPLVIILEHIHLSTEERNACNNKLQANGYMINVTDADTIAQRK